MRVFPAILFNISRRFLAAPTSYSSHQYVEGECLRQKQKQAVSGSMLMQAGADEKDRRERMKGGERAGNSFGFQMWVHLLVE